MHQRLKLGYSPILIDNLKGMTAENQALKYDNICLHDYTQMITLKRSKADFSISGFNTRCFLPETENSM